MQKLKHLKNLLILTFGILIFLFNSSLPISVQAVESSGKINSQSIIDKHNEIRASFKLNPLTLNQKLENSALKKAKEMIELNCWSHDCPPDKTPWDYFNDEGFEYTYAGENLAQGYFSLEKLIDAWMVSQEHFKNIVKPEFREIGIGIAFGEFLGRKQNIVVVVHFGTEVSSLTDSNLKITSPLSGMSQELDNSQLIVRGESKNITGDLFLEVNGEIKSVSTIMNGSFVFKIPKLENDSVLMVTGIDKDNRRINSNSVEVLNNIQSAGVLNTSSSNNFENNLLSITPTQKNLINLIFISMLIIIFIADLLLLSRTGTIKSRLSSSHLHIALFLIVGFVILRGGFSGSVIT